MREQHCEQTDFIERNPLKPYYSAPPISSAHGFLKPDDRFGTDTPVFKNRAPGFDNEKFYCQAPPSDNTENYPEYRDPDLTGKNQRSKKP